MSFLGDLLNTIGGAAHNVGDGVSHLARLDVNTILGQPPNQTAARPSANAGHPTLPMAQMAQRMAQPQSNVSQLAQIYNQNPMDPRVAHLDPAMFGYAPDNTAQPQQPQISLGQNLQQSQSLQGGAVNPGYIPFQNSGIGGQGYLANLQPAQNPQDQMRLR